MAEPGSRTCRFFLVDFHQLLSQAKSLECLVSFCVFLGLSPLNLIFNLRWKIRYERQFSLVLGHVTRGSSVHQAEYSSRVFLSPRPRCGVSLWREGPPGSRGLICPNVIFTTSSRGRKDRLWVSLFILGGNRHRKIISQGLGLNSKGEGVGRGDRVFTTPSPSQDRLGPRFYFNCDMFSGQTPAGQAQ